MRMVKFAFTLHLAMITAVALPAESAKLTPPATGKIQVAVAISDGAVMIDFAGPWEVFSDVMLHTKGQAHEQLHPFHLYTVAKNAKTIRTSGGMQVVPDYTFENAPKPNIVIVPAQNNDSPKLMAWIRTMTKQSDVVMSVCTGAFLLAQSGVLDGKSATTHHEAYATMETCLSQDLGAKADEICTERSCDLYCRGTEFRDRPGASRGRTLLRT
jgi:putative intracellular protease/amidase